MPRPGEAVRGLRLPNATLPAEPRRLAAREKRDVIAFLRASSDGPAPEDR